MVDSLKDVTVLSRGGLFTNEDVLSLAATNPGSAIRMLNMEISQFGGYRRVNGFVWSRGIGGEGYIFFSSLRINSALSLFFIYKLSLVDV